MVDSAAANRILSPLQLMYASRKIYTEIGIKKEAEEMLDLLRKFNEDIPQFLFQKLNYCQRVSGRSFEKYPTSKEVDIEVAHKLIKKDLHYNVMSRIMDMNEADILTGCAKSVSAKHYAMCTRWIRMTEEYIQAWQKFNINIPR